MKVPFGAFFSSIVVGRRPLAQPTGDTLRLLFSATPAYGHLIPLAPLVRAARDAGHEVAVLTSGDAADIVDEAMPGTELLPAGVMPMVFTADAVKRTGADLLVPDFDAIGEIFGGSRLTLSLPGALDLARRWKPDILICDSSDTVGPFVASSLQVDWVRAAAGPEYPQPMLDAIERVSQARYDADTILRRAPLAYIDPWPALMQTPGFASTAEHWPMQIPPYRRDADAWQQPEFPDTTRPTVLVTLGTIFSSTELLNQFVGAVAKAPVNVVATLGYSLIPLPSGNVPDVADLIAGPNIVYVPFVPLGELLAGVDAVVSVGGAGTVLGALTVGLPMVLWPQGADQPLNADRVQKAGAGIVIDNVEALTDAVNRLLDSNNYRKAAEAAAEQIGEARSPEHVIEKVTALGDATWRTTVIDALRRVERVSAHPTLDHRAGG